MSKVQENRILIAGGSGLIGTALNNHFTAKGWIVSILGRSDNPGNKLYFKWDLNTAYVDTEAFKNQDCIINLTGAGIADKLWTNKRKTEIISSRLNSIRLIKKGILESKSKPTQIIQASATGFYGNRPNEVLTEESEKGEGFLAEVCSAWENEAKIEFAEFEIPLAIIRIGVVLSEKGGFLVKIRNSQKSRINLIFGNGRQKLPWIHMDDLLGIFNHTNENNIAGVLNAVSPEQISLKAMQKNIAKVFIGKCVHLGTGNKLIKMLLGDFSEVFLNNQLVKPKYALNHGYLFKYPEITNALTDLNAKNKP